MTNSTRAPRLIAILAAVLVALVVPPASAAASQFPSGYQGYHTYAELTADVAATAAAHPDIVSMFSIGKSYQGRDIWAVKISDNVAVDENEPEVLYDGGTHSDEHMGVEMTLHIMHWLVNGYGTDPRITNIVNNREIYIVFEVNPDGAEYDISGGRFHFWRKNRQPTPGTRAIGTDLNRNFGYRWGLEGNTSRNPFAITYRGPRAFSAPETRAMRDFLASRVVNGRQQIRTAITFHEAGRLVMWPYGYTYVDIPPDMTRDDHAALVVIGRHMAATKRPATTNMASTGSSATPSSCRTATTRTSRGSPPRRAATRRLSSTSQSGPAAPSASSGRRSGPRAAARSTTTSRSLAAGSSTRTGPIQPCRGSSPGPIRGQRRRAARSSSATCRRA